MQIKIHLGKLKSDLSLPDLIRSQRQTNNIQILPIELEHVLELQNLPPHHNDPFDRLLIVQAKAEGALLVSKDKAFKKYPAFLATCLPNADSNRNSRLFFRCILIYLKKPLNYCIPSYKDCRR